MNISKLLKFNKDSFTLKNILRGCNDFWEKYSKLFFLLFTLLIFSPGVYFWFQIMYRSDWNLEQKKQYQNSQNKEVSLKEQQFKDVIEEFERKKGIYSSTFETSKDIFASYVKKEIKKEDTDQSAHAVPAGGTSVNNFSNNSIRPLP